MGDLVCDGTEFRCSYCTSPLKLCVTSSSTQGEGKNIANLTNSFFPPPGEQCLIKNSPCVPNVQVIEPGQDVVQVNNQTALGTNCKFSCTHGGVIQVSKSGQSTAQHVKTSPVIKPDNPRQKCSLIRTLILKEAHAIAASAHPIYYTNDLLQAKQLKSYITIPSNIRDTMPI